MNARNEGSFRDPFATVFEVNNRVFRGIKKEKILLHQKFLLSKFYKANAGSKIISTNECSAEELLEAGLAQAIVDSYDLWVEHERLDFISYPYEWGFEFLKSAGIFHLDLQLEALKHNYQLQDSSAYNIQFVGSKPIFIDTPSFIEYKDGDHWLGYKQFCEHFLAPLALNYYSNVEFNTLLRGSIDGISIMDASRILPFRSFLNLTIACNIHLHAWAISKISSKSRFTNKSKPASHVPKQNLIALLESLKRCLVKMTPGTSSYWGEYDSSSNSYSKKMTHDKKLIVENFVNSIAYVQF